MRRVHFNKIFIGAVLCCLWVSVSWAENLKPVTDLSDDIVLDAIEFKQADLSDIFQLVTAKTGLSIIAGKESEGKVSIYLKNVKLKDAFRIVLDAQGLAYKLEDGVIRVMPAAEFEARYGYKFGANRLTKIIHLQFADINHVAEYLRNFISPNGKIMPDVDSGTLVLIDSPSSISMLENIVKEIDVPVKTKVFDLSYASAKVMSEKIAEVLTKNAGSLKFDERSNKISVTDTTAKLAQIAELVEHFDVRESQVLIEAKVIQVILNDAHKYGVDWEAVISNYHNLDFVNKFAILNNSAKVGRIKIGTLNDDHYQALIEALETAGRTNILSSPSVAALNNQEAKILVGSTEPYVTETTTTPSSGPATTAESVNFIEVGVKLYVTPTIHKDGFITMKIKPEVSSVTRTITTSNNNTIPVVETSEAETTVMIKDGVTVVIGGLIKDELLDTTDKIPVLGDVPILGHAFRSRDHSKKKTEIVIILTPKIISGDVPSKAESTLSTLFEK